MATLNAESGERHKKCDMGEVGYGGMRYQFQRNVDGTPEMFDMDEAVFISESSALRRLNEQNARLADLREEIIGGLLRDIAIYVNENCVTSADTWIVDPSQFLEDIRALAPRKEG